MNTESAYWKIINMLAYIYEFLMYTKNCAAGWDDDIVA